MTTSYNTAAIRALFSKYRIVKTQVAKLFGYTNNVTVDRWLSGKDIYATTMARLTSLYNIDLLSLFLHDDRPFRTTIHDIVIMEDAGISLRDVLRERGIEPAKESDYCTLSAESSTSGYAANPERTITFDAPEPVRNEPVVTAAPSAIAPEEIIDRFIAMQTRAFEHEQQSLERQRTDMQAIIDRQDTLINEMKKELKKYKGMTPITASGTKIAFVNDDNTIDY